MNTPVFKNCKRCGRQYQLGVDGVSGDLCDEHAGVKRDRLGHAWFPGEKVHNYSDGTTITRKDAGVQNG